MKKKIILLFIVVTLLSLSMIPAFAGSVYTGDVHVYKQIFVPNMGWCTIDNWWTYKWLSYPNGYYLSGTTTSYQLSGIYRYKNVKNIYTIY